MADELKEDTSVLAGLLSTTDQLESLESLDPAFTTNTGSFRHRHVSESVSLVFVFFFVLFGYFEGGKVFSVFKVKLERTVREIIFCVVYCFS